MEGSVTEYEEDNDHPMTVGRRFQCGSCSKIFPNENSLLDHQKAHDPALIMHHCQYCDRNFATITGKKTHNCINRFTCQYCGDILESLLKKIKHEQEHNDQQFGHRCDTCGEKFGHQTTLDQHSKLHHSLLVKEHACLQCPRKFKHKTKLDSHVRSVHGSCESPYQCCNLTFKNSTDFKRHKIQKHPVIYDERTCNVCAKLIPGYRMKKHLQEHTKERNKVAFNCQECDELFATETLLNNHGQRFHSSQKCPQCDFIYTSIYLFKKHKMEVHGSLEGIFICECSKTFVTQSELKRHLLSHHEERLQQCNVCDKNFKSKNDLKQHERSHYEDERYKCDSCSRCFSQLNSKIEHQITHSNEKCHSCSLCGRKFKHAVSKTSHERTHQSLGGPGFKRILRDSGGIGSTLAWFESQGKVPVPARTVSTHPQEDASAAPGSVSCSRASSLVSGANSSSRSTRRPSRSASSSRASSPSSGSTSILRTTRPASELTPSSRPI